MNDAMAAQIVRTLAAGELPALPVAAPFHQAGSLQDLEVLRDGREAHVKRLGQLVAYLTPRKAAA